jgi:hypothetical protein
VRKTRSENSIGIQNLDNKLQLSRSRSDKADASTSGNNFINLCGMRIALVALFQLGKKRVTSVKFKVIILLERNIVGLDMELML